MSGRPAYRAARLLALLIPLALLGGALAFEYIGGLPPCQMCWWQRYPHFAAILLAALAFAVPRGWPVALAALALLVSGLIGAFHAGVEYGWWEGLTTCTASLSGSADPLEAIMNAPLVRCDVAPWSLFGVSLAGWNFAISTLTALAILWLLGRSRRPAG